MAESADYSKSVFINCPFDRKFDPTFRAFIFTISDCGFVPRCAREFDDGTQVRLDKIFQLIDGCKYAIHDLSRTELDSTSRLPRFNMPLELGIFLGAKHFGIEYNKLKSALILDREQYRYQKFISDIAGQDIQSHGGKPTGVIKPIRDWLATASGRIRIPQGANHIAARFKAFNNNLPKMCNELHIKPKELTFNDYTALISEWLKFTAP